MRGDWKGKEGWRLEWPLPLLLNSIIPLASHLVAGRIILNREWIYLLMFFGLCINSFIIISMEADWQLP